MERLQAEFDRSDSAGTRTQFTRAIEPDARPEDVRAAEEELNGRPVEWSVGN